MTAGLIVNPRSGSASGKGLALARMLEGDRGVRVALIESFDALPDLLRGLARDGVTELFISSGDGTIQAIQTELAERRPYARQPRLALLPHGTTNMTAADLGFRSRSLEAQAAMIRNPFARDVQQRHTLRIANPRDGRARHGMFLGAGAVAAAAAYCQTAFNARGLTGNWPVFQTLAGAVAKALFTRYDPADATRIDRPFPMSVRSPHGAIADGPQLLLLASTLERLVLGARPFSDRGEGAIRATVIPYPPPSLLLWTLPILRGSLPPASVSGRFHGFDIASSTSYVLDGEFFEGPEGEALRVETGPLFSYLRA